MDGWSWIICFLLVVFLIRSKKQASTYSTFRAKKGFIGLEVVRADKTTSGPYLEAWATVKMMIGKDIFTFSTSHKFCTSHAVWKERFHLPVSSLSDGVKVEFQLMNRILFFDTCTSTIRSYDRVEEVPFHERTEVVSLRGSNLEFRISFFPFTEVKPLSSGEDGSWENIHKFWFGEEIYRKEKTEEFPKQLPKKWNFMGFFSLLLAFVKAFLIFFFPVLFKRVRGTHSTGTGASGTLTVVSNSDIPENSFFIPGKVFPIRARFAFAVKDDDRELTLHSFSLKIFGDSGVTSDLLMNTGHVAPFFNVKTFGNFAGAFFVGMSVVDVSKFRFTLHQTRGLIVGARKNSKSFADQRYYSDMTMEFISVDGKSRLCRWRIVPQEHLEETGFLFLYLSLFLLPSFFFKTKAT
eukprot:TRINITY_DN629_c0_g2_i2.p1 TRINITY_DN629_c0_g2~~TRINITY_DN629_c0_g2_i2.p1  ORF type:complete len:407 (-),score=66.24 TRINITY_DN629_c0_g2_i2:122-1342(-)